MAAIESKADSGIIYTQEPQILNGTVIEVKPLAWVSFEQRGECESCSPPPPPQPIPRRRVIRTAEGDLVFGCVVLPIKPPTDLPHPLPPYPLAGEGE